MDPAVTQQHPEIPPFQAPQPVVEPHPGMGEFMDDKRRLIAQAGAVGLIFLLVGGFAYWRLTGDNDNETEIAAPSKQQVSKEATGQSPTSGSTSDKFSTGDAQRQPASPSATQPGTSGTQSDSDDKNPVLTTLNRGTSGNSSTVPLTTKPVTTNKPTVTAGPTTRRTTVMTRPPTTATTRPATTATTRPATTATTRPPTTRPTTRPTSPPTSKPALSSSQFFITTETAGCKITVNKRSTAPSGTIYYNGSTSPTMNYTRIVIISNGDSQTTLRVTKNPCP